MSWVLPNKERNHFYRENQVVSVCVGFTSTFFLFSSLHSQWGTRACPPTCQLYWVIVCHCCVFSLFQFAQVAKTKISISSSGKKKKWKKIYKTPQKSNINTKCDNSVLPWFITWKARSFEPPKNKPKTFGPEEPASVIEFSVERIPQAPCDGSAEPLGNWLSNKGGKSAF